MANLNYLSNSVKSYVIDKVNAEFGGRVAQDFPKTMKRNEILAFALNDAGVDAKRASEFLKRIFSPDQLSASFSANVIKAYHNNLNGKKPVEPVKALEFAVKFVSEIGKRAVTIAGGEGLDERGQPPKMRATRSA